jgi:hypothetical protein
MERIEVDQWRAANPEAALAEAISVAIGCILTHESDEAKRKAAVDVLIECHKVMHAAQPLGPEDRPKFLEALADRLKGCREIGDGQLYRVIVEIQKQHFDPPIGQLEPPTRRYAATR